MSSRWCGFFIWALVAASAAFWGIKIFSATRPVPAGAQTPTVSAAAAGPMERLFGAVVAPASAAPVLHPESERFQLVGVIAPPAGTGTAGGLAIVTIDGQPARAWPIGSTLDGNTTLLAVSKRTADFGPSGGPSAFTLQLPEPSAAETGRLPSAVPQANSPAFQPGANVRHLAQPAVPGLHAAQQTVPTFSPGGGARFNPQQQGVAPNGLPSGRSPPVPGQGAIQVADPGVEQQQPQQ